MTAKTGKTGPSEHGEQAAVIEWARLAEGRYPPLKWLFAIPNGAKLPYVRNKRGARFAPQALRLIAEGLKSGVSDLFLPFPNGVFCGLFIEMKVGSNKPTENQVAFLSEMNRSGYLATVCYTADHAIATIEAYLKESRRWIMVEVDKEQMIRN